MLSFLPELYPGETVYSFILRYHIWSGNKHYQHTMRELFGVDTPPSLLYTRNTKYLINQIPSNLGITSENLIEYHTILPFYKPFLPVDRWERIIYCINTSTLESVVSLLGQNYTSDIFQSNTIKVCAQCLDEDKEKYGEVYYHRNHQIPGNLICYKHKTWLNAYSTKHPKGYNKIIPYNEHLFNSNRFRNDNMLDNFCTLSSDIEDFLNSDFKNLNIEEVNLKYMAKLKDVGLIDGNDIINSSSLSKLFFDYYPADFLESLKISPVFKLGKRNLFSIKKAANPIYHILLIRMLFGSFDKFMSYQSVQHNPFGIEPFPCLNPIAEHYLENVIGNYKIYQRNGDFIGSFECSCGFTYCRKTSVENEDKVPIISKVVKYGKLWDDTLKSYVLSGKYTIPEITEKMKSSYKTIQAYCKKIKEDPEKDFHAKPRFSNTSQRIIERLSMKEHYLLEIGEYLKNNPNVTRTKVLQDLNKQCVWLKRHFRESLNDKLPPKSPNIGGEIKKKKGMEHWRLLDIEFSKKVITAIQAIRKIKKPKRITKTAINEELDIYNLNYNKMPITKAIIESNLESTDDFRKRRIDYYFNKLLNENTTPTVNMIFLGSGIRVNSSELKGYAADKINRYFELHNIRN